MKVWCTDIMSKRVTIVIDDNLDRKIRNLQAKQIQTNEKNVSYSQVINQLLRKELKK